MPSGKTKKSSNRIVLNVGGVRHETYLSTLKTIPDTRLCYLGEHHTTVARSPEYDASKGEYFFDRHPGVFAQILNFYRTGRLHCPADVCGPLFEEELGFWGIDEQQVETCCWENYKQHKDKQEKLKYFKLPGYEPEDPENTIQSKDSGLFEDVDDVHSWWSRYQPKVWKSLEEPYTSFWAKLVGIVTLVVFTAYIIKFALSSLEYFSDKTAPQYIALSVIHLICISWFTMDFALRLLFSPDKRAFVKSPYTWTDLISLVLLYVFFFHPNLEKIPFLEMVVMIKAARIFQLFRLSYVLQVLVNTLKASSSELCLLLVIMGFVMVVFASFVYFLERHEFDSDFKSVPESMWWAVITMTTVGYGEVHPRTWIGKTVGSACAICGVLVIALPVSVVASNFSLFYTYAKARLNVPPKKRRIAFSHALTSMQNQRTQCAIEDDSQAFNFMSLYGERQTDRSYPASEVSISCSMTPRGSLRKSSFWSLRSFSKMLRPSKRSNVSRSKSLHSVLSDYRPQREMSAERITLKFDPPSRSPSTVDVAKDQRQGSLTAEENALLNVPADKGKASVRESMKDLPRTPLLNKSLYPLHLRRGAVSPASFSLKSASTASSLNALPRGYNELCNALSGKGPIILLSDQASVQSLCSLHSRMTCSCLSLKSAGSEESQGGTTYGNGITVNLTPAGSDGSFVSSPPAKSDGVQATLSVPLECHGKRRNGSENQGLPATESAICKSYTNDTGNEAKEATPVAVEPGPYDEDQETDGSKRNENTNTTENTRLESSSEFNLTPESLCKNRQEIRGSPFNLNTTNDGGDPLLENDNNFEALETKLPVKPVPVVGRAVSAYPIMEYSLYKDTLPSNRDESQECEDLCNTNNDKITPKRRHSAFTPCNATSSTKRRQERFSNDWMQKHVTECEPLINRNLAQDCPNDVLVSDADDRHDDKIDNMFGASDQCSGHTRKSLRKSGASICYSPTRIDHVNEDSAVAETEKPSTEETDEGTWIPSIPPCPPNGYLSRVTTLTPDLERTSCV